MNYIGIASFFCSLATSLKCGERNIRRKIRDSQNGAFREDQLSRKLLELAERERAMKKDYDLQISQESFLMANMDNLRRLKRDGHSKEVVESAWKELIITGITLSHGFND